MLGASVELAAGVEDIDACVVNNTNGEGLIVVTAV